MADVHTREIRSYNMSQIKGKDTKPEMIVRKFLFSRGYRYRVHDRKLAGRPDIVLKKYRTVIFVHGCFWHGHKGCKYYVIPKTRTQWWIEKIDSNSERDLKNFKKLILEGWRVITIFECELMSNKRAKTLNEIVTQIY